MPLVGQRTQRRRPRRPRRQPRALARRRGNRGRSVMNRRGQEGGLLPLLALIPAAIAAGKAAALGAAGYGIKKALAKAGKTRWLFFKSGTISSRTISLPLDLAMARRVGLTTVIS